MSIKPFLEYLEKHQSDRGLFADLRHGFSEGTEYRAWPHIARFGCKLENDKDRKIWTTVAAGFATHKKTAQTGNMGLTIRNLALCRKGKKDKDALENFQTRLNRFLACDTAIEVCDRLPHVIRMAHQMDVLINFFQLYKDLKYWNKEKQIAWASQYWQPILDQTEGEKDHVPDTDSD